VLEESNIAIHFEFCILVSNVRYVKQWLIQMNLDSTDLKLFINIAACGNLTHGACATYLSPPAASARIKAMEYETGTSLLYRSNKGVSLTAAGKIMRHRAQLILRQMDYLEEELTDTATTHLRIFANTTAVTEFLPKIVAQFLVLRPGVTVDLQERLNDDIVSSVANDTADIGIISGAIHQPGLKAIRFSTDRLMLAVAPDHPLARRKSSISLEQTLEYEHIALHDGSTMLDFLRLQFSRSGYDRTIRFQVRSFEAMCKVIEAGVGIGVVPESAAIRHSKTMNLKLLELADNWALRDRSVLVRDGETLSNSVQALIDMLKSAGAGGKWVE
jgi:DNA-binding transcriptional LysR family regulator